MSLIGLLLTGFGPTGSGTGTDPVPPPSGEALSHSPADIVRYLLVNLSRGSLPEDEAAWPIYVSQEPDHPDSCITVYDTSGIIEGRAQISGEIQEHYGIQIKVRAASPTVAYAKISEVNNWIDKSVRNNLVTIESSQYLVYAITRKGGILSLGKELSSSKRNLYTVNAIVSLVPVA